LQGHAGAPSTEHVAIAVGHPVQQGAGEARFPVAHALQLMPDALAPKGVHIAIAAVREYNRNHPQHPRRLRIAGKHYSDTSKDAYWQQVIEPQLSSDIEYAGFLQDAELNSFLAGATALLVPSTFPEPFGMVSLEALASGTPVIGLSVGATAEIIEDGVTGFIITSETEADRTSGIAHAISRISEISRQTCQQTVQGKFTLDRMIRQHADLYAGLVQASR
jgi:glycosyltransferase involved in cell wall biosynthesis